MTSPKEALARYRKARRIADRIITAHGNVGCTLSLTETAELMTEPAWLHAGDGPSSAATRAVVMEMLSEHERALVGSGVAP